MKKLDFGRNLNIEKFENEEWTKLIEENRVFENYDKKELFLLCLAIGYKSNIKKPLDSPYPTVNATLTDQQKYLLLSFGVKEAGEGKLPKTNEIKSSASQYAKAGFKILQKIVNDSDDDLIVANEIFKKIKELSKR